jgi:hypothetical protein
MKIQYEPAGRKEVARLLQGIKDQQPQALFDAAPAETRGCIPLHVYETALSCSNAQAVIREIRAQLAAPGAIKRVALRIQYAEGKGVNESFVNLVS